MQAQIRSCQYRRRTEAVSTCAVQELSVQKLSYLHCSTGAVSIGAIQELSVQAQYRSCQYRSCHSCTAVLELSVQAQNKSCQYRSCQYRRRTEAVSTGAEQKLSVQELSFLHCSTGAVSTGAVIPALQYWSCQYRRNAASTGAVQKLSVQAQYRSCQYRSCHSCTAVLELCRMCLCNYLHADCCSPYNCILVRHRTCEDSSYAAHSCSHSTQTLCLYARDHTQLSYDDSYPMMTANCMMTAPATQSLGTSHAASCSRYDSTFCATEFVRLVFLCSQLLAL